MLQIKKNLSWIIIAVDRQSPISVHKSDLDQHFRVSIKIGSRSVRAIFLPSSRLILRKTDKQNMR